MSNAGFVFDFCFDFGQRSACLRIDGLIEEKENNKALGLWKDLLDICRFSLVMGRNPLITISTLCRGFSGLPGLPLV